MTPLDNNQSSLRLLKMSGTETFNESRAIHEIPLDWKKVSFMKYISSRMQKRPDDKPWPGHQRLFTHMALSHERTDGIWAITSTNIKEFWQRHQSSSLRIASIQTYNKAQGHQWFSFIKVVKEGASVRVPVERPADRMLCSTRAPLLFIDNPKLEESRGCVLVSFNVSWI